MYLHRIVIFCENPSFSPGLTPAAFFYTMMAELVVIATFMEAVFLKLALHDYISICIHQTDLTLTNYVKQQLSPFHIAPEQNLIMMLLWEKDGLNQNEIAEKLNKDKTNIARMVVNLEQKGFIKRLCDEHDRRLLRVYLTDDGKCLGNHVLPIAEKFNDLVTKGITDEELQFFRNILAKMCANVQ